MADSDSASSLSSSDDEGGAISLKNPDVITKYQLAAEACNGAMRAVTDAAVPGAKVSDVCAAGDAAIEQAVSGLYKKFRDDKGKPMQKGIAFPTCVSVNNCAGHYCPLDEESAALAEGDLVQIDLGAHVDGFAALSAQTVSLGDGDGAEKKAAVLGAAWTAMQAALRLVKPGNTNTQVTEAVGAVCAAFGVNPVEAVLSHQMEKSEIMGDKCIISRKVVDESQGTKNVEEVKFEEHEVWGLDIAVSSGGGKPIQKAERTTVFRRNQGTEYKLKMKTAKQSMFQIMQKAATMPFSLRQFQETDAEKDISPARFRLGLTECIKNDLLSDFPVLFEEEGEFIGRFKCTVLLLPNNVLKVTGLDEPPATASEVTIEDEALAALLATPFGKKKKDKKKKKKKKKKKSSAEATE